MIDVGTSGLVVAGVGALHASGEVAGVGASATAEATTPWLASPWVWIGVALAAALAGALVYWWPEREKGDASPGVRRSPAAPPARRGGAAGYATSPPHAGSHVGPPPPPRAAMLVTPAAGTGPPGRPPEADQGAQPRTSSGAGVATGPTAHEAEAEDRRRLVELCIDLADRLRTENPALHGRLRRGLAAAGVTAVEPDGEAFDRHHHDAVDVEPAPSADRDRTVASTERLGFVDRGAVVRRPEVVVYAWEEGERVEH